MTARLTMTQGIRAGLQTGLRLAAAALLAVLSGAALAFITPPAIDTTPPVITSAPQVVYVSNNRVTIRWVTDEIADSTVSYGKTGESLSLVGTDVERRTEHLITLTGLAPATPYSYSVASTDPSGNTIASAGFSFTTAAAPDTTAPSFSAGPSLANLTSSSVELSWMASEPASAVVAYGTSAGALNQHVTSAEFKTGHGMTLTNLAPSTTYFVAVTATDVAGNSTTSSTLSFATLATAPTGVSASLSGNNIVMSWSAVSGATGYNIYMANQTGVTKTNYASLSGGHIHANVTSPYLHASAAPGIYYLVVTALNGAGESVESSEVSINVAADTQAPSVPTGLTATAVSAMQINLFWTAANDNFGVTSYRVDRGGVSIATLGNVTSYSDTGLTVSTTYSYTVAACDAAGNCSAQSASASATTPASGSTYTANLEPGFNLIGNSLNTTLNVATIFGNQDAPVSGVTPNIVSIWKWNAVDGRWAFYSPQLTVASITSFAASKNYDVLATIGAGEGYWVNAISQFALPAQTGSDFNWSGLNFSALPSGFNLIAHSSVVTPSQFNADVSQTPPASGVIPTDNFVSLWAWDAVAGTWYFYSPLLEASGGLPAVKNYADSHFFRHFQDYNKTLGLGVGFWVNRP